jgi:hypothetical protein
MRYLLQLIAMLSDIMIIGASAYVLFELPLNPLIWILIALTYRAWYGQGGFMAWQPKNIKMFLANAKKAGL